MPASSLVLFHWEKVAGQAIIAQLANHGFIVAQADTLAEAENMVANTGLHHVLVLDHGAGNNANLTRALALKLHAEGRVAFVRISGSDIPQDEAIGGGVWKKNTDVKGLGDLILSVMQLN